MKEDGKGEEDLRVDDVGDEPIEGETSAADCSKQESRSGQESIHALISHRSVVDDVMRWRS